MANSPFVIKRGLRQTATNIQHLDSNAYLNIDSVGVHLSVRTGSILDLSNIDASSASDGQGLIWDSAASKFIVSTDVDTSLQGITNPSNTALGVDAMSSLTSGTDNLVIGEGAFDNATIASRNVMVGDDAGSAIISGDNNVIIGRNDGSSLAGKSNQIIIADGQGNIFLSADSAQKVTASAGVTVVGALTFGSLTNTTDDVTEGSTNLYYTTVRFDSDFGDNSTTDLTESGNLYYTTVRFDSDFGTMSTTDLTEGSNLYYTTARFDSDFGDNTTTDLSEGDNLYYTTVRFDSDFALKTTADLTEGSNLYYTTVRFDSDFGSKTLDALTEGSNLYYTAARFDSDFGTMSTTDLTEGDNLFYTTVRFDSDFGDNSTTDLAEGNNLFYTTVRFDSDFSDNSTTDLAEGNNLYYTTVRFDSDFALKSTTDLTEGDNLYYTVARMDSAAKHALEDSTGVTYNPVTGVVSIGQPVETTSDVQFSSVQVDSDVKIESVVTTSSSTAQLAIDEVAVAEMRSGNYSVTVTSGTDYQTSELLVLHDDTSAQVVEFGTLVTGSDLATFNADISGGNVRLLATPANATTTFKISKTVIGDFSGSGAGGGGAGGDAGGSSSYNGYDTVYTGLTSGSTTTVTYSGSGVDNLSSTIDAMSDGDALLLEPGEYEIDGIEDTTDGGRYTNDYIRMRNIAIIGETSNAADVKITLKEGNAPRDTGYDPIFAPYSGTSTSWLRQFANVHLVRQTTSTSNYATAIAAYHAGNTKGYAKNCIFDMNGGAVSWRYGGGTTKTRFEDCSFVNYSSWLNDYSGGNTIEIVDCVFDDTHVDTNVTETGTNTENVTFDDDYVYSPTTSGHLNDASATPTVSIASPN